MATKKEIVLKRREVVARILRDRGDALVVPGLGAPTWDAAAAGDHPLTFQMWGAMGGTAMIALGLALAQRGRRVIALPGDGDMLMGIGSLATIGTQGPPNLVVAVIDNERYGETGMQETHTARGVDLEGIARCSGFANAATSAPEDVSSSPYSNARSPSRAWRKRCFNHAPSRGGSTFGTGFAVTLMSMKTGPSAS